ncbi:hypothetical protein Hanom_Chr06g00520581 [Helianthus anomalus]
MCFECGRRSCGTNYVGAGETCFRAAYWTNELVVKKKANKKKDLVVQEFRNQFEPIDSKRLSPLQLMRYILDRSDYGWLFVVNFLVVYFSFMGETTTNNSVNMRNIPCIQRNVDIKSFDWCSYMVSCLNKTKKVWHGGEDAC